MAANHLDQRHQAAREPTSERNFNQEHRRGGGKQNDVLMVSIRVGCNVLMVSISVGL